MIAASTTEPPVGASTCASGSQVCTGHIGTLTENAARKAKKSHVCTSLRNGNLCQVTMSKLPPLLKYRYTSATSISSEPASVNRKNLNAAYTRLGPPHTPMMMYIGISVPSKKE